jgi:hypothetical protein
MGVKNFITTFVTGVPAGFDVMRKTCISAAIDTNQFIHHALTRLIIDVSGETPSDKVDRYKILPKHNIKTPEELLGLYQVKCKQVLDDVINELRLIENLRELYIAMDGTPCSGKIHNQIDRRRNPKYILGKDGTVLLSSAHILPGTPLMNAFTDVLKSVIKGFSESNKNILTVLSLTDIPGEGEHKAIDYLHASFVAPLNTSEQQDVRALSDSYLIWSNDSDVIVSLLHRGIPNVFVMTESYNSGDARYRCINVDSVRENLCSNYHEVLNAPLLLAFAGNDFLPEMLDTIDLERAYKNHKAICAPSESKDIIHLTKEDKPTSAKDLLIDLRETGEVLPGDVANIVGVTEVKTSQTVKKPMYGYSRVIDSDSLRMFCRAMSDHEIKYYYMKKVRKTQTEQVLLLLPNRVEYTTDRVKFKRDYYTKVHIELSYVGASPIDPRNPIEPSDSELYDLEMTIATAYLRTYYWYYYYQSGMYMNDQGDSSSYPYTFPPLYSSLFIVLDRADPIYLASFDPIVNPALRPVPRDPDYFRNLKTFTNLHHFLVLQTDDYRLLYSSTQFNEADMIRERNVVHKSSLVKDRVGKPLVVSKRMLVESYVTKYRSSIDTPAEPIKYNDKPRDDHKRHMKASNRRFMLKKMVPM